MDDVLDLRRASLQVRDVVDRRSPVDRRGIQAATEFPVLDLKRALIDDRARDDGRELDPLRRAGARDGQTGLGIEARLPRQIQPEAGCAGGPVFLDDVEDAALRRAWL